MKNLLTTIAAVAMSFTTIQGAWASPSSEIKTPSELTLVSELPDGVQTKEFIKSGIQYYDNPWYGIYKSEFSYSPVDIARSGNEIYITAGKLEYETDCYLVGTVGDYDIVTFEFPQWVGRYTSDMGSYDSYLAVFELEPSDEVVEPGYLAGNFVVSETQAIQMQLNADGSLELLDDYSSLIIGNAYYDREYNDYGIPEGDPHWIFNESGEIIKDYKEFTQTPNSVPDGISFEDWECINGGISKTTVGVGMQEDKIYIKGLLESAPELVLIGNVEGDKATFATNQYMGAYNGSYVFFLAARIADRNYTAIPDVVFDIDLENKIMTTSRSLVFSTTPDRFDEITSYDAPSILIPSESGTAGMNLYPPKFREYYYNEDQKQATIILPKYDKDGYELNTAYIYYTFYIDGKPMEITNPPYSYVVSEGETITEIPYNADGYNLYNYGTDRVFMFFEEVQKSFAVQLIYRTEDFESKSEMIYAVGSPTPVLTPDYAGLEAGQTTVMTLGFSDKEITDEMMSGFKAEITDTNIAQIVNSNLENGSVSIEVKGIAAGETYLTAEIDGISTEAVIKVTQVEETLQISPETVEVKEDESAVLELSIKERDITEDMMESLSVEVADKEIAEYVESVLEEGKVNIKIKGLKEGDTKVVAGINGKSIEAAIKVTPAEITLQISPETVEVFENEVTVLELSIKEKDITEDMMESLSVEVADKEIAEYVESVLEGGKVNIEIKGLKAGETKVVANIKGKSIEATVTVKKEKSINEAAAENAILISEEEITANGCTIHVYSTAGNLILTGKDACNISALASGLYIIEAIDLNGNRECIKFIK